MKILKTKAVIEITPDVWQIRKSYLFGTYDLVNMRDGKHYREFRITKKESGELKKIGFKEFKIGFKK